MKESGKKDKNGKPLIDYVKNELCIEPVEEEKDQGRVWRQKIDWHYRKMCFGLSLSFVLLLPRSLIELPLHLHCRGDHPGKGAGKELGARVLFATWMSKEHFRTDDQRGFYCMVPMLLASKLVLCAIQLLILYQTRDNKLWVQIAFKSIGGIQPHTSLFCFRSDFFLEISSTY